MKKIFYLIIFLLLGTISIRAEEGPGDDQGFMKMLDGIKNPFEDGYPKPVVVAPKPIYHPPPPRRKPIPVIIPKPKPKVIIVVVKFPRLDLEGVMVGEDIHEAIINGNIVPLNGSVDGVFVHSITKDGVEVIYKGKKKFLKVE